MIVLNAIQWYLISEVHTVCNPMDCSPPGSSVHWISQARILEWVAISLSREIHSYLLSWPISFCLWEFFILYSPLRIFLPAWWDAAQFVNHWRESIGSFSFTQLNFYFFFNTFNSWQLKIFHLWQWVTFSSWTIALKQKEWIHLRKMPGLPWWLSSKESACQCRGCGLDPGRSHKLWDN